MKITSIASFNPAAKLLIPLMESKVQTGFPSPADDYLERSIDLNKELIKHPKATFFVRVTGDSMKNAGIFEGCTLVVDHAVPAVSGKIIVTLLNGEFTVKRLMKDRMKTFMQAENEQYADRVLKNGDEFEVWGVVTNVIQGV